MKCPFCGGDMCAGIIRYDTRVPMRFESKDTPKSALDRFWDALGGIGILTATQHSNLKLEADYCPTCRKMIFETDITR